MWSLYCPCFNTKILQTISTPTDTRYHSLQDHLRSIGPFIKLFIPSLLRQPFVHAFLKHSSICHPSSFSIHPEQSFTDIGSVIHLSISQSISHPSSQLVSAATGWGNQSGQVMWVIKRKSLSLPVHRKTQSHDPFIFPLWLTYHLSVSTHLPLCSLRPHCLNSWLIFSQRVDSHLPTGFFSFDFVWFFHSFLNNSHEVLWPHCYDQICLREWLCSGEGILFARSCNTELLF